MDLLTFFLNLSGFEFRKICCIMSQLILMTLIEYGNKYVKTCRFNIECHISALLDIISIGSVRNVFKRKSSIRDLIFYLLNVLSVRLAIRVFWAFSSLRFNSLLRKNEFFRYLFIENLKEIDFSKDIKYQSLIILIYIHIHVKLILLIKKIYVYVANTLHIKSFFFYSSIHVLYLTKEIIWHMTNWFIEISLCVSWLVCIIYHKKKYIYSWLIENIR